MRIRRGRQLSSNANASTTPLAGGYRYWLPPHHRRLVKTKIDSNTLYLEAKVTERLGACYDLDRLTLSPHKRIHAWFQSGDHPKFLGAPLSWAMVAGGFLLHIGRILLSRLTLAILVAAILGFGPWFAPPLPGLPEPNGIGTILGTLLAAQGAIAALTLAVSLFMMQGVRARREVDDRIYPEYVKRSWIRDIFWGSILAVGVTGVLLLSERFISAEGMPPDIRPDPHYFVPAAGLAFLLNLLLAGVLFERAILHTKPAQWRALRWNVDRNDVRQAVKAFLGRALRARKAREAHESDLSILFPDQGEGSADEAIRALLDDARRAMLERRRAEFKQSLDFVMELIKYAMGEIRKRGISWGAPGSQPEWPLLRQLSRNLYSLREDVIREGDRDYILEPPPPRLQAYYRRDA